ncbi:MAG: peptide deformylase [Proteobacteria bacterium]|nr:peptide deformylase [Pseudomonadota bacterium]MCL2308553.1 peptide deformylase [Pseudomonadota bacterium]
MALLPVLEYPDPRLKTVARPVAEITPEIRQLIRDMAETMYAAPGIGLAATQVDFHQQVVVIDISETKDALLVLINPEIIESRGEIYGEEGCLSVPGYYDEIKRAETITVRAMNEEGQSYEFNADGILAVCIQHEIDHLRGKVFVDYLSILKRSRVAAKLKKQRRVTM